MSRQKNSQPKPTKNVQRISVFTYINVFKLHMPYANMTDFYCISQKSGNSRTLFCFNKLGLYYKLHL